ncbi:BTAD domain-containing putative transcriptional regulator [Coralloluteibacterium stylophorae]|uniref:Bacterial transcriptional activator domain-containing protein n=1 Tax=Coralloluteibacterium stylophorae TaxID=1776034 RepID=A0A8J7VV87_9GAMM|nr:BTAD domain-containing putative transcriptional regulator [Coralloluteibacterium stylophorae]MBS7456805.1 hypothetical protein [Coralloluteibacterium stylophorae]
MSMVHLLAEGALVAAPGHARARPFAYRKGWALLGYLAMAPQRRHARGELACLLWPDLAETSARTNLRQVLADLNLSLAGVGLGGLVRADKQWIGLDADLAHRAVDVLMLDAAHAAQGPVDDALRRAGWVAGDLLQGMALPGCDDYEDWLRAARELVRVRAGAYLACLRDRLAREARRPEAIDVARRLAALDDWNESHLRALMSLLAEDGRRREALRCYARLRDGLRDELGAAPEAATIALHARIAADLDAEAAQASAPVPRPAAGPAAAVARADDGSRRFVALVYCDLRNAKPDAVEARCLEQAAAALRGAGAAVLTAGGRTLLGCFGLGPGGHADPAVAAADAALAVRQALGDGVAQAIECGLVASGFQGDYEARHGGLAARTTTLCMRARAGEIVLGRVAAGCVAARRNLLPLGQEGDAEPSLWRLVPGVPAEAPLLPFVGRREALRMLADCLARARAGARISLRIEGGEGSGRRRLLREFIDGIAADPALRVRAPHLPEPASMPDGPLAEVIVVDDGADAAADAPAPVAAAGLLQLLVEAPSAEPVPAGTQRLRLGPLSAEETRAFAGMLVLVRGIDPQRVQAACARGGGYPADIEALAAVPPSVGEVPASRMGALQREIDRCGRDAQVLRTIALLDGDATRSRLAALLEEGTDVGAAVARLWERDLLEDHDGRLRIQRPLLRAVAVATGNPAWRKRMHRDIAALLSVQSADAATLAVHTEGAGDELAAMLWWREAARGARARGALGDAVQALRQAARVHAAAHGDAATAVAIALELATALALFEGAGAPACGAVLDEALERARDAHPEALRAVRALRALLGLLARPRGRAAREIEALEASAAGGRDWVRACAEAALALRRRRADAPLDAVPADAGEAPALALLPEPRVCALLVEAWRASARGDTTAARAHAEHAAALACALDPAARCLTLLEAAQVLRAAGCLQTALTLLDRLRSESRRNGFAAVERAGELVALSIRIRTGDAADAHALLAACAQDGVRRDPRLRALARAALRSCGESGPRPSRRRLSLRGDTSLQR